MGRSMARDADADDLLGSFLGKGLAIYSMFACQQACARRDRPVESICGWCERGTADMLHMWSWT